ncbi:Werner Syndrome-like exonuclease [Papaver somniferum]|uniref:Werner Syndrome-like exonuclease n=1 Tax=Papaver somniferum TaxID=3469 RepID=UPI000E704F81|nr:Werner Syndrome-like exonuclease [Papaver somniferum]
MAGSSVEKVQNGLSGLSLGDQMSSNSSTNGGNARGDKNTGIVVVDKSKDTHHTYKVFYYKDTIFTTVTHTASVVDQWLADLYKDYDVTKLNNSIVVGLDIEWIRLRSDNSVRRNKVAVLQLCLDKRCLIFQFACCDQVPKSLKDFLGNNKFIFVGSGVDADAHKLKVDHGLMVARTEELGSLAAYKLPDSNWLHRAGLKNLVKEVLQQELPKRGYGYPLLSNWESDFLSDEQIEYACLDAVVSFKLGFCLMSRAEPSRAEPSHYVLIGTTRTTTPSQR